MTYLELINKYEKILITYGHNKSVILNIIYLLNDDIKDLTTLTEKINDEVDQDQLKKINSAITDYLTTGKPIAYSLNKTIFAGNELKIRNTVLPPRPETEEWTKALIDALKDYGELNILDLCCGSGAIGLSIKKAMPYCNVTLVDISREAYLNTKENAEALGLDVNVVQSNLFEELANARFDVIVFNPPYVDEKYPLDTNVAKHEPYNAIYAPNRGLWYYESIIKNISKHLRDKYLIMMEIGFNLAGEVCRLIQTHLGQEAQVIRDSNFKERVVVVNRL